MNLNEDPPVPDALRDAYRGWQWLVVSNWPQSITYRLSHPEGEVRYLKLVGESFTPPLRDEDARLRWARSYLPVPEVLEFGSDHGVSWLITRAMAGVNATSRSLLAQPARLVEMLAQGLRRFHEAPVDDCPFDFRLDSALAHVETRVASGHVEDNRDFHPEHQHLPVEDAVAQLRLAKPQTEDLVVCHGDYCFPNVLIEGDRVVGFVDLGELAVADRWWDLAVATWSTTWNVGPGFEDAFLDAYGIEPDADRIKYYRLLYDLAS